jgi:hypothetical protein
MKKCLSFMIILLLICNVAVAIEAIEPLWIGIVRTDGILLPIGTYYKDKWTNTWPELSINEQPEVDNLVKATNGKVPLQDIPGPWKGAIKAIPATVYLWSEEHGPKNLKVLNAEQYSSHCSGGWALKTNLQPTKKEKGAPTPKVGIATNSNANVIPFKMINSSKIGLPLLQAIKAKFDEKEKVSPGVSLKDREKGLIELSRIFKARDEIIGRSLYFIEAQRKYPKPSNAPDADCYNLNSLNSWVMLQGNKISFLSSEFVASDCDGKEMNSIVPDVVISVQGRHYIVSENYGYEWESYTINEILDGCMKEVLKVDGGGC